MKKSHSFKIIPMDSQIQKNEAEEKCLLPMSKQMESPENSGSAPTPGCHGLQATHIRREVCSACRKTIWHLSSALVYAESPPTNSIKHHKRNFIQTMNADVGMQLAAILGHRLADLAMSAMKSSTEQPFSSHEKSGWVQETNQKSIQGSRRTGLYQLSHNVDCSKIARGHVLNGSCCLSVPGHRHSKTEFKKVSLIAGVFLLHLLPTVLFSLFSVGQFNIKKQ